MFSWLMSAIYNVSHKDAYNMSKKCCVSVNSKNKFKTFQIIIFINNWSMFLWHSKNFQEFIFSLLSSYIVWSVK